MAGEAIGDGVGSAELARLVRSVRRLTVAVWGLVIAFSLLLGTVVFVVSMMMFRAVPTAAYEPSRTMDAAPELRNFSEAPVQDQIRLASVIALARYEKEGDRLKCVISEVMKQTPGTVFHYKVGDTYSPCGFQIRPNTNYGEGQVIFFVGSPASMRYSVSIHDGRIGGLGDLPLDTLRRQIANPAK